MTSRAKLRRKSVLMIYKRPYVADNVYTEKKVEDIHFRMDQVIAAVQDRAEAELY